MTVLLQVDDRGLVSIGRYCSNLRDLELTQSYCQTLTDVGLSAVLVGCPRLQRLVLKGLKGVRTFITLVPGTGSFIIVHFILVLSINELNFIRECLPLTVYWQLRHLAMTAY